MKIYNFFIITVFENLFNTYFSFSFPKKGLKKYFDYQLLNLQKFSDENKIPFHLPAFGGIGGMLVNPLVLSKAIKSLKNKNSYVILLSPQGKKFSTEIALELLNLKKNLIFVNTRFEGFDQRILNEVDMELSVGDYVLNAGEIATLVVLDAIIRLIPDFIKKKNIENDSFYHGLLDCNNFTKPVTFNNIEVPNVLRSGNHKEIEKWKNKSMLENTYKKRKDLLLNYHFSNDKIMYLWEIIKKEKIEKNGK
ncbi:tRNA (guanosine(37)-N1)-methyltransferase TrmD [symbiont of Argiope bruennichi]|uniref:tRNA (guanosine(37)-N1)-methyltransferase TrmD n=1 Tax=symbiont of Argiope bruennichi TaxID=2810479 RepID=UPI003DA64F25